MPGERVADASLLQLGRLHPLGKHVAGGFLVRRERHPAGGAVPVGELAVPLLRRLQVLGAVAGERVEHRLARFPEASVRAADWLRGGFRATVWATRTLAAAE